MICRMKSLSRSLPDTRLRRKDNRNEIRKRGRGSLSRNMTPILLPLMEWGFSPTIRIGTIFGNQSACGLNTAAYLCRLVVRREDELISELLAIPKTTVDAIIERIKYFIRFDNLISLLNDDKLNNTETEMRFSS